MSEIAKLITEAYFPIVNNPAGVAFTTSQKRWNTARAGRRSFKTVRGKRRLVKKAMIGTKFSVSRYGAFAPTRGQAKKIFWEDLKNMTRPLWIKKPNETELTIYILNSYGISEIIVAGLDEPARIEGVIWDHFLIDESDDIKDGFWKEHLRPCLSNKGRMGTADFIGVPNGMGFLYSMGLNATTKPNEYGLFEWHSAEVLPASEIAAARDSMDPRTFRQEYEGSCEAESGRIYYAFDRIKNVAEPPTDLAATAILSVGMDFNVNPMSAVVFFETALATYVVDAIDIETSNTEEMIAEIRERYGSRVKYCYPDPTGRKGGTNAPVGQSDHSLLKRAGFDVKCHGQVSVKDGINATNSRFCSATGVRRLFISAKCVKLIEALDRHCYKKGTSQPDKTDGFDHYCDSLRYSMDFLHPIKERQQWQQ